MADHYFLLKIVLVITSAGIALVVNICNCCEKMLSGASGTIAPWIAQPSPPLPHRKAIPAA